MKIVLTKVITHAVIAAGIYRAFSRICLFVRTLTGKRLELSTPNLVHIHSIAVTRHTLTQRSRSHGYKNRHGHAVPSDYVPYSAYQYSAVLPAAIAGVGLHVNTTAYVF